MIVYIFSFVLPYLLVLWLLSSAWSAVSGRRLWADLAGRRQRLALCAVSLVIVLVPPAWIPLGRWIVGVNANFSIPLTAILFARVWENLTGGKLFDRRETLAAWLFGLAAGVVLYPMALGLGGFDPYVLGWEFSWLSVLVLAVTIALLYTRNRFGMVLVVSVLAYDLGLLESPNLWDYLVDPFYAVAAAGALASRLARARRGRGEAEASEAHSS